MKPTLMCRRSADCTFFGPCILGNGEGSCDRNSEAICDVDDDCPSIGPCVVGTPLSCSLNDAITCSSDLDCTVEGKDFGACGKAKVG